MIEYINDNPVKMLFFFFLLSGGLSFITLNLKNPKRLFFFLIFYIPLSFTSASGCLAVYLAIILYLWSIYYKIESKPAGLQIDIILVYMILIACVFSFFNTEIVTPFFKDAGKIRITPDFLVIIVMFSNISIYVMVKKFIISKNDLVKAVKFMVISGSVASIVGYLQWLAHGNVSVFKYIVFSENSVWQRRVAATMQGYEMLAEYTAILIVFTIMLYFLAEKRWHKVLYFFLSINFLIIMTLTQTRGIYIAIGLSIIYFAGILFVTGRVKHGFKFAFASVTIIFLLICSIYIIDQLRTDSIFIDRFGKFTENVNIKKGEYGSRTEVWQAGADVIGRMSFGEKLFGTGFKFLPSSTNSSQVIKKAFWPHCLYLSYIIRDGFIGLALFIFFLAWLYKKSLICFFRYRLVEDKQLFFIGAGLHLALIIFIIDEIKIEFIRTDRSQNIFWLLFGLIAVCSRLINQNLKKD